MNKKIKILIIISTIFILIVSVIVRAYFVYLKPMAIDFDKSFYSTPDLYFLIQGLDSYHDKHKFYPKVKTLKELSEKLGPVAFHFNEEGTQIIKSYKTNRNNTSYTVVSYEGIVIKDGVQIKPKVNFYKNIGYK